MAKYYQCIKCSGTGKTKCTRCNGTGKEPDRCQFHTELIDNWSDITKYRDKLEGKSWLFRGQANTDWPLETSLRRHCEIFPTKLKEPKKAEGWLLREFRRRYHQYSTDEPKGNDYLEWFSIMQHHGAPTRLLDFSYSMSIAAYFALENTFGDCSIFAINPNWAKETSQSLFKRKSHEYHIFDDPVTDEEKYVASFEKMFIRGIPKQFALPINPFRLTERLTIQKGVFMCPGDISKTFEENLCSMTGHDKKENIIRLIISSDERLNALESLYNQNVTRAALFPGLDGFASSLRVSPPKLMLGN